MEEGQSATDRPSFFLRYNETIINRNQLFRSHKKLIIMHMQTSFFQFLFFSVVLSFPYVLYSQNNYRPGFIITLQKDTLYGEIDYRTDIMNSKRCIFRSLDNGEKPLTYHPFEILGYRFTDDGKYYVSRNIELEYGIPQAVFLEYLLQGIKSLYYYEMEGDIPIYFIEDNNRLVKIDAPQLAKNQVMGTQFKSQTDQYIPLLRYAFKDCPNLAPHIDKAHFNRKELMKITKEYHYAMCTNNEDCIEFEAKEDKHTIQLNFTPYAGVIKYVIPSNSSIGLYSSPDLSYLAGITLAISNKRWMSSAAVSTYPSLE